MKVHPAISMKTKENDKMSGIKEKIPHNPALKGELPQWRTTSRAGSEPRKKEFFFRRTKPLYV